MSIYLFVSHLCSVYFNRTARERYRHLEGSILLRWVIWHVTFYFAYQRATLYVIHYSKSPALTNLMHRQVPATILKLLWLTLLSICIHPNGWDHYLLLTKHWPSGRDSAKCTWIMHVDTRWAILNSVLYMWHMLVFFLKYQPRREGVVENETIT